jgi:hypothetical protein
MDVAAPPCGDFVVDPQQVGNAHALITRPETVVLRDASDATRFGQILRIRWGDAVPSISGAASAGTRPSGSRQQAGTLTFRFGTYASGSRSSGVSNHAPDYTADSSMADQSGNAVSTTQVGGSSSRFSCRSSRIVMK